MSTGGDDDRGDGHGQGEHGHHPAAPSPIEDRVAALERMFVERGWLTPETIDDFVKMYEQDIGPLNGAKVAARAWVDPEFKRRLLADGTAAIAELGFGGAEGDHLHHRREHRRRSQRHRVHALLLLSLAGARPAT